MPNESEPLLAIDVSNICYRSWYVQQKGVFSALDVLYSFFQTIKYLHELFGSDNFVFCFDHPASFRKKIYPAYKRKRHEIDPTRAAATELLHQQMDKLRQELLPAAGFRHILYEPGMEADDLLAAVAEANYGYGEQSVVLVSTDQDLYQCLNHYVSIFNLQTKKAFTCEHFRAKYGIASKRWAWVKAAGGCSTDGVPGIRGVGEKTAIKYLKKELPSTSAARRAIDSQAGQKIIHFNRPLVQLPGGGLVMLSLDFEKGGGQKINWNGPFKGRV